MCSLAVELSHAIGSPNYLRSYFSVTSESSLLHACCCGLVGQVDRALYGKTSALCDSELSEAFVLQLKEAPGPVLVTFTLIAAASFIPLLQGMKPESQAAGPFTAAAEMLNGRAAYVAPLLIIFVPMSVWKAVHNHACCPPENKRSRLCLNDPQLSCHIWNTSWCMCSVSHLREYRMLICQATEQCEN